MDDTPDAQARPAGRVLDRRILDLALPALGALVAEPLFVLVDSAVVGRLGTSELAGLTLASTLLVTTVALFIFLAYATTGAVARRLGAGDEKGALAVGMDGIWLALGLGALVLIIGYAAADPVVHAMGASEEVAPHALAYLRTSLPGIPGMLVVLAATGALRGLQDTRTPLRVAVAGAIVNAAGSVLLVHGVGMGIAGSGLATASVQIAMALTLMWVVLRAARTRGVSLRPEPRGILANGRAGLPLLIRTLTLRAAVLLTVATATSLGDVPLAAHQIVNSVWMLAAFVLDALAIAAQALVGHGLGARRPAEVRAVVRRCLQWGTLAGIGVGALIALLGGFLTPLFTSDPAVQHAAHLGLIVIGVLMPVAAWPFVLDGVLMGAGDGVYLAWAGGLALISYLPLLGAVARWAPEGALGLMWLWVAFAGGFLGARALTTWLRSRGSRWMVLGV
ncbi:MATE family efflux transporter [Ruania alkalisoli]|uniref:MATE family efflux transporter n=1 Tax=Ruania alkalisoli TaxID=2779775 RepID=A0A7M1ST36_9MICO|nr:MATE family efflux transporter [Ruania alkalisoli]QOR70726.1 MATE family efflux transporter [Ruania alkalisoli]